MTSHAAALALWSRVAALMSPPHDKSTRYDCLTDCAVRSIWYDTEPTLYQVVLYLLTLSVFKVLWFRSSTVWAGAVHCKVPDALLTEQFSALAVLPWLLSYIQAYWTDQFIIWILEIVELLLST